MTDFGYASDGTPVQWTVEFAGESDERGYWQDSWGNPYEVHEVTPARVVGPGQVAVDAATLRAAIDPEYGLGWHEYAINAMWTAINSASHIEPTKVVPAGPGEVIVKRDDLSSAAIVLYHAGYVLSARILFNALDNDDPEADHTPRAASGGGSEAGGDERPIVHNHDLDPGCPERYDRAGYLRGRCVDPYLFDETPAAEPERATLPDTPWTTVRVTLDDGDEQVWYTIDEAGVWYDDGQDVMYSGTRARVVDFTILAQPPKADPAETDAPRDTITRANLEDIGDAVLRALGAKPVYDPDTGAFLGAYTREIWDYTDE